MRGALKRDLYSGISVLVAVQIVIAFGAIGLLSRMAPAIERIMTENVYSLEAAEDLMATLAGTSGEFAEADRAHFDEVLARLRGNVSVEGEGSIVDVLAAQRERLFAGDAAARSTVTGSLRQLTHLNRLAMRETDEGAQRLGRAGAWSAVFVSLLGFVGSFAVIRRLRTRVVDPVMELYSVIDDLDHGATLRRCTVSNVPEEIRVLMEKMNRQLDRWALRSRGPRAEGSHVRVVLLHLLDSAARPTAVIGAGGALIAASTSALALLDEEGGGELREDLRSVAEGKIPQEIEVDQVGEASIWICTIKRDLAPSGS